MSVTLSQLETKKKSLIKKLSELGNFRRGTISVRYRKCGKKICRCHKPNHPGHGPHFEWTTTIQGKSYAKHLKPGSELKKYKEEIDNWVQFQSIQKELIDVNEKICQLKPQAEVTDSEMDALKKKLLKMYKAKLRKK